MNMQNLPLLNATLNGLSGVFLTLGWFCIRSRHVRAHMTMMICALVSSTFFLAGYVTNHILRHGLVTRFTAPGAIRLFYFPLLITHTFLAVVTVPMVIFTVTPALQRRFDKHRRIARWTLPVWLYVSVTGVIVYLMLYRWYPPAAAAMAAR